MGWFNHHEPQGNSPPKEKHPRFQPDDVDNHETRLSTTSFDLRAENESLDRQHRVEVEHMDRNQICSAVLDMNQQINNHQQSIDELMLEKIILLRAIAEKSAKKERHESYFRQMSMANNNIDKVKKT
ncbi:hypothetical protein ScalyP_jg4033 [Parmales sp. scaly parma]|nr:hypothetical protein ScalyP_jg4033 [Parmales sp. scaly parma]